MVQVTSGIYKWCHSNNQVMSIKNARFKPQPSTQIQTFASMRSTSFMEINDKGGEIVQRYESFEIMVVQGGETRYESFGRNWNKEVEVGHGHRQRGSNIEEMRWIKILGQEKHISRGSKLMNFDWLHLICAYSCACLHCISFLNPICMLVWCMLVVELGWWFDN